MADVALAALAVAGVLMVSSRLERFYVSVPLILVLTGWVMGQHGFDLITIAPTVHVALEVTELTLGLLLFADAASLDLGSVIAEWSLEARLLTIGLLLSVLLGTALAIVVFPGVGVGLALLLAAALAPTDAALGLPIVHNPAIPVRIRQTLNVESGLNDGIVTPIVAFALAMAISEGQPGHTNWIRHALAEIGLAVVAGVAVGALGGWLLRETISREWTNEEAAQLAFFGLAVASFFGARNLEGNGFIAAFVGGLVCGRVMRGSASETLGFTEKAGNGLSFVVWLIFGAALMPVAAGTFFDWRAVIFAVLALTLMRMVPVAIATRGMHLRSDTIAIIGWFGPRGLASVVFLLTAFVGLEDAGEPVDILVGAMAWTIFLSVVFHGLTATPLGTWYGRRLALATPEIAELRTPPSSSQHLSIPGGEC